jgi:hypothetical protein
MLLCKDALMMFDFISAVSPGFLLTACFLTLGILTPFLITYYGYHKLAAGYGSQGIKLILWPMANK